MAGTTRERKCLVSGEVLPSHELIRFVLDPDGMVVADVAAKLPGRGAWVTARRDMIEKAVDKGLFTRFCHKHGGRGVEAGLVERVEALLLRRCLEFLGLANRAGSVIAGFEKARAALAGGKSRILLAASDGADDGRNKMCRGIENLRVIDIFTRDQLGQALGRANAVHMALLPNGATKSFLQQCDRYGGLVKKV